MEKPLDLAAPAWHAAQLACRIGSTDLRNASSARRPGNKAGATQASLTRVRFSALTAVHLQVLLNVFYTEPGLKFSVSRDDNVPSEARLVRRTHVDAFGPL